MAWAMVSLNLDESPEIGKRSLQNKDGAAPATPNTKAAHLSFYQGHSKR
jgi:hypothetical protein